MIQNNYKILENCLRLISGRCVLRHLASQCFAQPCRKADLTVCYCILSLVHHEYIYMKYILLYALKWLVLSHVTVMIITEIYYLGLSKFCGNRSYTGKDTLFNSHISSDTPMPNLLSYLTRCQLHNQVSGDSYNYGYIE